MNRESGQEIPSVCSAFPGTGFCFLETPALIGHEFPQCTENSYVLHYCYAGHIQEKSGDICNGITSGDIWITPPRQTMGTVTLLTKRYSGVSMLLEPEIAQDAIRVFSASCPETELDLAGLAKTLQHNRGTVIPGTDKLSRIFSQLFMEKPPCKDAFYRLKAMELLLYLAAWEPQKPRESPPYLEREMVERVDAIRRFATEHLDCRMTQAQIASRFHISLTALKRTFRSTYGLTLDAYLREQRISAAKRLLLETELPVSEIAHRVGYESHSQFTSVFHSSQGQTPAQFRRTCRGSGMPPK